MKVCLICLQRYGNFGIKEQYNICQWVFCYKAISHLFLKDGVRGVIIISVNSNLDFKGGIVILIVQILYNCVCFT